MKLVAKRFSEEDIADRVSWVNHESIYTNMYFDFPASVENTRNWYNSLASRQNRMDFSFYDLDKNICVGMAGVTDIDLKNGNAEFYVFINPELQGKGIGKSITQWTINYSFLQYSLNKVFLKTDTTNRIAIKVYERLGFQQEGVQRKHTFKSGEYKDRVLFGLLRYEWSRLSWATKQINLEINVD